jgi:rhamnosyltransferase
LSSVSLIIRCFNEEAHIGRLLTGVSRQIHRPDQIVIVDSGSTDATLSVASAFDVEVVSISPERFSFGHALNVGLEIATGEVAVIASAHVYPIYDTWIKHLVGPFEDEKVAVAYGRQQVPPGGEFSEGRLLAQWFPSRSIDRQRHPFCNNANAAIRRLLWETERYDEQLTGLEDLAWAKRAMDLGYDISYVAEAPIFHVHNETFAETRNRYRREAIAQKAIYEDQRMSVGTVLRLAAMNMTGDLRQARRQGDLAEVATDVIRFRTAQFLGTYQGFAQDGPANEALKRRFYYPSGLDSDQHLEPSRVGNPIDYNEPAPAR